MPEQPMTAAVTLTSATRQWHPGSQTTSTISAIAPVTPAPQQSWIAAVLRFAPQRCQQWPCSPHQPFSPLAADFVREGVAHALQQLALQGSPSPGGNGGGSGVPSPSGAAGATAGAADAPATRVTRSRSAQLQRSDSSHQAPAGEAAAAGADGAGGGLRQACCSARGDRHPWAMFTSGWLVQRGGWPDCITCLPLHPHRLTETLLCVRAGASAAAGAALAVSRTASITLREAVARRALAFGGEHFAGAGQGTCRAADVCSVVVVLQTATLTGMAAGCRRHASAQ